MDKKLNYVALAVVAILFFAMGAVIGALFNNQRAEVHVPEPPEPRIITVTVEQQHRAPGSVNMRGTGAVQAAGNEYFNMWFGQWGEVYLVCRANGYVYITNPIFLDMPFEHQRSQMFEWYEGYTKTERFLHSQIALVYSDEEGRQFALTSFPYAVSPSRRHIRFDEGTTTRNGCGEQTNPTLTAAYTLGTDMLDWPLMAAMTEETFRYYNDRLYELSYAGYIDSTTAAILRGRYTRTNWELLVDSMGVCHIEFQIRYPNFSELGVLYLLKPFSPREFNDLLRVNELLGIDEARIIEEMKLLGAEVPNKTEAARFRVPLVYELNGRELLVSVDTENLYAREGFEIERIYLLGTFGAVPSQVPYFPLDGSVTVRFTFS